VSKESSRRWRFTVEDVRAACTTLPPPQRQAVFDVDDPRIAAILLPITEVDGEAAIIATKRHGDMRSHRDDWVFPGGQLETGDASSRDAARREASEELGIPVACIELIGQLDTHGPIITGYLIDVFVGVVAAGTRLDPDENEVAEVAVVPLSTLLEPERSFMATMHDAVDPGPILDPSWSPDAVRSLRWYELRDGEHLWGMQGNILYNLLHHLTMGAHTLGE
jgi:8-oxo-dGTP pyrophosphatase MutT (NUDIX family)